MSLCACCAGRQLFPCSHEGEIVCSVWRVGGGQKNHQHARRVKYVCQDLLFFFSFVCLHYTLNLDLSALHLSFSNFQTFEALTFVNIHKQNKIFGRRRELATSKFGGSVLRGKVVVRRSQTLCLGWRACFCASAACLEFLCRCIISACWMGEVAAEG